MVVLEPTRRAGALLAEIVHEGRCPSAGKGDGDRDVTDDAPVFEADKGC